jgi:ubiquinone/menaquinone biosynthesis C-methylase UbiE
VSSSAAEFSGSVPAFYDRYLGPVLFEPYAVDLVSRLPSGDGLRVLEIACGTGIVTRRLREALPDSAVVVATDLNEAMIVYARAAVPAPGIVWKQADAQALAFHDGSFDVVVCQFGLMFLPDKVQGFREARRVLASGGVLLASVWHSMEANPAAAAIHATLATLFSDDPPRFVETPYGYHDTARIRADMKEAGWRDVQLEDVLLEGLGPSAADFAAGFTLGSPLAHDLAGRDADVAAVTHALTGALIPVGGEQPFKPPLAATVIRAVR